MSAVTGILLSAGCPLPTHRGDTSGDVTPQRYAITVNSTGEVNGEKVTASVSEATEGTIVTLSATLDSSTRKVSFSTSESGITPHTIFTTNCKTTFIMPAKSLAITATFADKPSAATPDNRTANTVSFNMHYVHSGTFTMGEDMTTPAPEITLTKDFWMGETEITQGLWEAVWGLTWPGTAPAEVPGDGDSYPAYNVNWYDAVAFCNLLTQADDSIATTELVYYSDADKKTAYTKEDAKNNVPVYVDWSKTGYRLPTEAEWEYTARYKDADNSVWNGGDHVSGGPEYTNPEIENYGWFNENSHEKCYEVKRLTANALGLYDMSGNINEWCYDWIASYKPISQSDPVGPENGTRRILRGGSWSFGEEYMRVGNRYNYTPSARYSTFGFRLCRTAY